MINLYCFINIINIINITVLNSYKINHSTELENHRLFKKFKSHINKYILLTFINHNVFSNLLLRNVM